MRKLLILCFIFPALCVAASSSSIPTNQENGQRDLEKKILISNDNKEIAISHLARGDAHLQNGELEIAISAFDKALTLDNSLDIALLHRALAYGYNKQHENAITDLNEYIKRNPKSSLAYTKRGLNNLQIDNVFEAVKDYQRAIELDKNNAEAHDDLGVIYVQSGKLDKAINYFRVALLIDPEYIQAWHNIAMANLIKGKHDTALEQVDRALALRSDDANALLLKSVILESMGEIELALKYKKLATELQ